MKVVATSDLHPFADTPSMLQSLADRVRDESPDLFAIAGNLGQPIQHFEAALTLFENLDCPRVVVTGNRDIWCQDGQYSSQQLWEEIFPIVIRRHGYTWLEQENLITNRLGVCGTTAWYDYSARDTTLGYTPEQYEKFKGLVNQDIHHIDWNWSDQVFASLVQRRFTEHILALDQDQNVDHILVITHMPVFKEAVRYSDDDARWNFGAAYAFNLTLGRVIAPRSKVREVVSGHSQIGGQWEITFGTNTFRSHVIGRDIEPHYIVIGM